MDDDQPQYSDSRNNVQHVIKSVVWREILPRDFFSNSKKLSLVTYYNLIQKIKKNYCLKLKSWSICEDFDSEIINFQE